MKSPPPTSEPNQAARMVRPVGQAKARAVMEAMLQMTKIEVPALRRAYDTTTD